MLHHEPLSFNYLTSSSLTLTCFCLVVFCTQRPQSTHCVEKSRDWQIRLNSWPLCAIQMFLLYLLYCTVTASHNNYVSKAVDSHSIYIYIYIVIYHTCSSGYRYSDDVRGLIIRWLVWNMPAVAQPVKLTQHCRQKATLRGMLKYIHISHRNYAPYHQT